MLCAYHSTCVLHGTSAFLGARSAATIAKHPLGSNLLSSFSSLTHQPTSSSRTDSCHCRRFIKPAGYDRSKMPGSFPGAKMLGDPVNSGVGDTRRYRVLSTVQAFSLVRCAFHGTYLKHQPNSSFGAMSLRGAKRRSNLFSSSSALTHQPTSSSLISHKKRYVGGFFPHIPFFMNFLVTQSHY
jgi:hypothetical protein